MDQRCLVAGVRISLRAGFLLHGWDEKFDGFHKGLEMYSCL